jgi:hypothetical protein
MSGRSAEIYLHIKQGFFDFPGYVSRMSGGRCLDLFDIDAGIVRRWRAERGQ